jgi:hypothetical protein
MHIFARCGQSCTLTLSVPANGSFADLRAALLAKRPRLAACDDLVGMDAADGAWCLTAPSTVPRQPRVTPIVSAACRRSRTEASCAGSG